MPVNPFPGGTVNIMLLPVGSYLHQQSFALCVDVVHGPTPSAWQSAECLQVLGNQVPP